MGRRGRERKHANIFLRESIARRFLSNIAMMLKNVLKRFTVNASKFPIKSVGKNLKRTAGRSHMRNVGMKLRKNVGTNHEKSAGMSLRKSAHRFHTRNVLRNLTNTVPITLRSTARMSLLR